ncbi:MAG TPA: hypothetical protein VGI67_02855 [Thermoleophilaceae bacterium]|jgi:hypothetical protein
MARIVRLVTVVGVMVAAVAVYAGVATGHNGGGSGSSGRGGNDDAVQHEDHHNGDRHDRNGDRHGRNGDRHGGKHRGNAVIEATLAPSQPTDPTFHGVAPGGVPWVLTSGSVELKQKGKLELRVRGLVIPPPSGTGTAGPVTSISASLYCGADSDTTAADTTATVPLSQSGNARIEDKSFAVPSTCLAPVILVHPNGDATHYIAAEGWRM